MGQGEPDVNGFAHDVYFIYRKPRFSAWCYIEAVTEATDPRSVRASHDLKPAIWSFYHLLISSTYRCPKKIVTHLWKCLAQEIAWSHCLWLCQERLGFANPKFEAKVKEANELASWRDCKNEVMKKTNLCKREKWWKLSGKRKWSWQKLHDGWSVSMTSPSLCVWRGSNAMCLAVGSEKVEHWTVKCVIHFYRNCPDCAAAVSVGCVSTVEEDVCTSERRRVDQVHQCPLSLWST